MSKDKDNMKRSKSNYCTMTVEIKLKLPNLNE